MFVLLGLNILVLIYVALNRKKWMWVTLYGYEVACFLASAVNCAYYDSLPGSGKAPGLTYFGEVMYYFFSCVGFGVVFVITSIVFAIFYYKDKRSSAMNRNQQ